MCPVRFGAALRDRQRLDDIAYLTPDRMAHPTHRALLTALVESRTSNPTTLAPQLSASSSATFVLAYDEHDAKPYRWTYDGSPLKAA
ncbi:hypothetical protein ACFWNL_09455 [Kitasatospora sp. NPDC058397]|uniref:hypothetical protein n=1 Tax=unclassified Kitasatospora TaxID=2633591 RepID=UPI0036651157